MTDYKTLIIIALVVALVMISSLYIYGKIYQDAFIKGQQYIIVDMNQNSYFPVIVTNNNITSIQKVNLNELCRNAG